MKFRALALCLAGTMVAALPAAAQHNDKHMKNDRGRQTSGNQVHCKMCNAMHAKGMHHDAMTVDAATGRSVYAGERIYLRDNLWPDLAPQSEVARKVSEIIEAQRHEQAMLQSLAPRAQTAGYTNVSMVYDHLAADHDRIADFASNWLRQRGYSVPSESMTVSVSDVSPQASVDQQIQMHADMFNKNLDANRDERSSTVRGLRLWAAAGSVRHLSILRALDRDVEFGRKTASARLQSMIDGNYMASDQTALMTRIYEEEMTIWRTLGPTETTVVASQPIPMQVVEVERIVERPVERIVERTVEVPVERIVERTIPARQPVRSRVAGRRQTGGMRRPAK